MAVSNIFNANVLVFEKDAKSLHANRELLLTRPPTNGNATKTCNQSSIMSPPHDVWHGLFYKKPAIGYY